MSENENNFSMLVRSPDDLGLALKNRRLSKKLTQSELGEVAHTHQRMISRIESGHKGGIIAMIFRLMALLDLEIIVQSRRKSSSDDVISAFK